MKITRIEPQKDGTFLIEDENGVEYIKQESEINLDAYKKIAGGVEGANLENILNERNKY